MTCSLFQSGRDLESAVMVSATVFPEDAFRLLKTEVLLFAGATTFVAKEAAMTLLPTWMSAAEELRRTGCTDMGHAPTRSSPDRCQ